MSCDLHTSEQAVMLLASGSTHEPAVSVLRVACQPLGIQSNVHNAFNSKYGKCTRGCRNAYHTKAAGYI